MSVDYAGALTAWQEAVSGVIEDERAEWGHPSPQLLGLAAFLGQYIAAGRYDLDPIERGLAAVEAEEKRRTIEREIAKAQAAARKSDVALADASERAATLAELKAAWAGGRGEQP